MAEVKRLNGPWRLCREGLASGGNHSIQLFRSDFLSVHSDGNDWPFCDITDLFLNMQQEQLS